MEFSLVEGSTNEFLSCLQEEVGAPLPLEMLMFLRNGRGLDLRENAQLSDGDRLWVLPQISGG